MEPALKTDAPPRRVQRARRRRRARDEHSLRSARQRLRRSSLGIAIARTVRLPLIGDFNVVNALGAAAAAFALGVRAETHRRAAVDDAAGAGPARGVA